MPFDGITMNAIAYELNNILVGGKIDKIAQAENDEILLTIRNNQTNYKLLLSANSSNPRAYIATAYNKENPLQAPIFLMILRKHIGNGKILKVKQYQLERVLEIQISAYDELRILKNKTLIVEIMGKHSNIILVDDEMKIIDSIKRIPITMSSLREVLPNRPYTLPPSQNKNNILETITLDKFQDILIHPPQEIYKSIYKNFLGLSPAIAKEICFRASIDYESNTASLNEIQIEKLYGVLIRISKELANNKFSPCIIKEEISGKILDFSSIYLSHLEDYQVIQDLSISKLAESFYINKDTKERINQKTQGLRKSIQIKIDRLRNKFNKQCEELEEAKELGKYKKLGELLTAHIYMLKQGMSNITVIDYFSENQEEITIPLNPRLNPSGNIQSYFKKYTKSKNRITELSTQTKKTKDDLDYLENIMLSISNSDTLLEIDEIKRELYKQGFSNQNIDGKKSKKKVEPSSPLEFMSSDGVLILVGKNNTQNDMLTFQVAEPTDVWLHTKDIPGSHVIIKGDFDIIPDQTVREAAVIAAYYSKARESDKVPVDYTIRKNIRKPNTAKPGFVVYDSNYTTYAKPNKELIDTLKIKKN